jgi:hypothetical protein
VSAQDLALQVHFDRAPPGAGVALGEGPQWADHARIVDQQIEFLPHESRNRPGAARLGGKK